MCAYRSVQLTNAEFGFPSLKRQYYGLETFLEHPFDGKWYGKIDYVFSRSYGDTEGQLRSDIQQTAASTSIDWDFPELMSSSNGAQSNDHTHQIKLFGYYQIAPQWLLSGNVQLTSGNPRNCLGYLRPQPNRSGWLRQLLPLVRWPAFTAGNVSIAVEQAGGCGPHLQRPPSARASSRFR